MPHFTTVIKPTRKPDTYRIASINYCGTVHLIGERNMVDYNLLNRKFRFLNEINECALEQKDFQDLSSKPQLSKDFITWIVEQADESLALDVQGYSFAVYSDPGHGWLAIPMRLVEELGIKQEISSCSYLKYFNRDPSNGVAYLEEDCDAEIFIQSYLGKYGKTPLTHPVYHEGESWIRRCRPYPFALGGRVADQANVALH